MSGEQAPAWLVWLLGTVGLGLGAWLFASSFSRLRLRRKVADTPTSRVRSVAMGPAELKGLAEPLGTPLVGPFSGTACCWWAITVEQEEIRHTKNGTRREWRQIHAEQSVAPFNLMDSGAAIPVLPGGAEIECPRVLEAVTGGGAGALLGAAFGWLSRIGRGEAAATGALSGLPGPATVVWASGGAFAARRRLREWRIDPKRPLYVLGVVRAGRPGEGPSVGLGRAGEPFLISTESEQQLLRRLGLGIWGRLLGGAAIILIVLVLMLRALGAG